MNNVFIPTLFAIISILVIIIIRVTGFDTWIKGNKKGIKK